MEDPTPTEPTPEPTSNEIDLDSATADLSAAFAPQSEPEPTTPDITADDLGEMPEDTPPPQNPLDGTDWGSPAKGQAETAPAAPNPETGAFDPSSLSQEQIEAVFKHAQTIPDGSKLFPDQPETIQTWDKFRAAYDARKQEVAELKKQLESGTKSEGTPAEVEKLRKEYEAIDRIRNSEAYASEVMAPQAQSLAKAKEVGQSAGIDDESIEEIFRANTAYEAVALLKELHDPAAEELLKPLVQASLEARQKGTEAIKSTDPLAELKQWQSRSAELNQQQQQMMAQQESQMDKVALNSAFAARITETPIGKTKIAAEIRDQIAAEIDQGIPVDRDTVYEGLIHQKLAPIKDKLISQQFAELTQLRAELDRLGAAHPAGGTPPTAPQPKPGAPVGGLPAGMAWATDS